MTHGQRFLQVAAEVAQAIDPGAVERVTAALVALRERGGRLFVFGAGGSAANAAHAVNDFRKLCGIEAYSPTDNAAELTARVNDDGWDAVFDSYLRTSRADAADAVLVLSVGGGDLARHISVAIIRGLEEAQRRGLTVLAIVGREPCFTAAVADAVVVIPAPEPGWVTPLAESFQAVVWHAVVSDPRLATQATTW